MPRTRTQIADDRALLVAAIREAGRPLRADEVMTAAWGHPNWDADWSAQRTAQADLHRLVHTGVLVVELARWCWVYRLATDADLADRDDAAEVQRMMAGWEPAD